MNPYRTNQTPVWVLIGINFLVFIFTSLNSQLGNNLALSLYYLPSQPWTLITSMFVHANFLHIFSNMLALYFLGIFLLQLLGTGKFLLVYFIGGIVGNLVFLLFANYGIFAGPFDAVVGASGAIYAIGGALAVLRPNQRVYLFFAIPMPLWIAIIVGFLIILPGVAWQAHLGGLAFGALAGWYFRRQYNKRRGLRW